MVNFDVPMAPDDYIHRVGRTGRAEMTGEAFTFVSPQEEGELKDIERVLGRRLPRVTVPDFDYAARPQTKLDVRSRSASRKSGQETRRARARRRQRRAPLCRPAGATWAVTAAGGWWSSATAPVRTVGHGHRPSRFGGRGRRTR